MRKKSPQADIEEFKAKCRELRRFATEITLYVCVCPQTGQVHRTLFCFLVSTTAEPALPAPRLVLWCLLVQSVSAGPSLWVSGCTCDGPVCHACGMVCCDGSCLHLSSWQQRLRPCVGLCLYTMLRVLFRCPSFLH